MTYWYWSPSLPSLLRGVPIPIALHRLSASPHPPSVRNMATKNILNRVVGASSLIDVLSALPPTSDLFTLRRGAPTEGRVRGDLSPSVDRAPGLCETAPAAAPNRRAQ